MQIDTGNGVLEMEFFTEDELIEKAAKNMGYQVAPDGFLIHPVNVSEEVAQIRYNQEYKRLLELRGE